ncbi:MAG: peptide-binding protein [Saprospiraceae bacterium]|nr:MAG: peptide-binding protein [Saprospiraceae bacterium]
MRFHFLLGVLMTIIFGACVRDQKGNENVTWNRTSNEVICRIDGEPDVINTMLTSSRYTVQVCEQVFAYLMYYDPYELKLVPQLANSQPEVQDITSDSDPNKGGKTYTFEIREQAVWDDGQPVTGQDYVFTLKALFHPQVQAQRYRPYLNFVKDVIVDEDNARKFTVITLDPPNQAVERLGNTIPILPAHHYDPDGILETVALSTFFDGEAIGALVEKDLKLQEFAQRFASPEFTREAKNIMGAGPYRLEQLGTGQPTVLVKKENWWGDALADQSPAFRAFPDRLVFKAIVDPATVNAAIKSEELDVVSDLDPKDFKELKENPFSQGIYNFHAPPLLALYLTYINTRNPKLSDKRVRRALALSVNINEIIDNLYFGMAKQAVSPVHPLDQYFNADLKPLPYDPEQAKVLLAEAGWTDTNQNGIVDKEIDGELVEMSLEYLIVANSERSRNLGIILQDNARKSGVELKLVAKTFNELTAAQKSGNYELSSGGRSLAPTDWEPKQNFYTVGDNRTGFGNAETDQLIDELQKITDKDKRRELYHNLQAIIYEEQPEIYLLVPTGRIVVHKRFDMESSIIHPGYFPQHLKLKAAQ